MPYLVDVLLRFTLRHAVVLDGQVETQELWDVCREAERLKELRSLELALPLVLVGKELLQRFAQHVRAV